MNEDNECQCEDWCQCEECDCDECAFLFAEDVECGCNSLDCVCTKGED